MFVTHVEINNCNIWREMVMADRVVKLNVGGVLYTTSKSTLTSVPQCYLCQLVTGAIRPLRDERGTIFIDRDGHIFRYVLNYLRSKKLTLPQGYKELAMLKEEAEYYDLCQLVFNVEKVLKSRRRNRNKPRNNKGGPNQRAPSNALSRSLGSDMNSLALCDENGSVIFEDDSSDYFYD
ncbi:BTB/POZ domain-containing protein KCTD21-like [Mytilus edulis]